MGFNINNSFTEISVEDIAVLKEAYFRKLDERKVFMPQISSEELGNLFQVALRNRYSILSSHAHRVLGSEIDDHTHLSVTMPKDSARKDIIITFTHSVHDFANRYRMNDDEMSLITRDHFKEDPELSNEQRRVLEKEIGRMAEESRNRKDIVRLSDSELSNRVDDVKICLDSIAHKRSEKLFRMQLEYGDKPINLKNLRQELEWRSKTLHGSYFISDEDEQRCFLIATDYWTKACSYYPSSDLAKDLSSERRSHLQDVRITLDQIWDDTMFRYSELDNGYKRNFVSLDVETFWNLGPWRDMHYISYDFAKSAAMFGYDWNQVKAKIDEHLVDYPHNGKRPVMVVAEYSYCRYNEETLNSYSQHIGVNGSDKGYDFSSDAREYMRRMSQKAGKKVTKSKGM